LKDKIKVILLSNMQFLKKLSLQKSVVFFFVFVLIILIFLTFVL